MTNARHEMTDMRAVVTLRITFNYHDEYAYAQTFIDIIDRAQELGRAEVVGEVERFHSDTEQ